MKAQMERSKTLAQKALRASMISGLSASSAPDIHLSLLKEGFLSQESLKRRTTTAALSLRMKMIVPAIAIVIVTAIATE